MNSSDAGHGFFGRRLLFRLRRDDMPGSHHCVDRPEDTVEHMVEVPRMGGAPPCHPRGDRRRRPVASGLGRAHGAGRCGGVGSRHLLLRSSYASEGDAARAGAACYRLTPPPSPDETPGASDIARRSPATVGTGVRWPRSGSLTVRSGPSP